MKAKIVYVEFSEDSYSSPHVVDGIDWEEMAADDVRLLARNIRELPDWNGLTAKLVVQSEVPLKPTLSQVVALLKERERAKAEKQAEAERRRSAKARVKAAKDLEAKKRLLAQLQEELGAQA
jgi:hypothetical protein